MLQVHEVRGALEMSTIFLMATQDDVYGSFGQGGLAKSDASIHPAGVISPNIGIVDPILADLLVTSTLS